MGRGLWTPQGEVGLAEKNIIELLPQEVRMLADLHEFAHKHQINIFCKRCEQPVTGQNNDAPGQTHVSVACQCREWRFKR